MIHVSYKYMYLFFPLSRLCMDQLGGIELDETGAKRRKWMWKDQLTHVHAPPFQPIHFSLNHFIGVRILSQERMVLDFSCGDRGKRFNVGSRLKVRLGIFYFACASVF